VIPESDLEGLAQAHVRSLSPYTPGFQPDGDGWIKLNTNENPYPASPRVAGAVESEIERLRLYPNPRSEVLLVAAGGLCGVGPEQVIAGNGSDDILNLLVRVFGGPARRTGFTVPGYSLYPILVSIAGGMGVGVEFDRSMELPVSTIAESKTQLFFLTSPNAPTGVGFATAAIDRILKTYRGILVVDEAYADFAEENAVDLLGHHANLVIVRTLSKSYGLAGIRIGYAVGSPLVINLLDRVRDSYNVNRLSQAAAVASLADQSHFRSIIGRIKQTRENSRAWFEKRGWFVYPSAANFLFVEPKNRIGDRGEAVAGSLFEYLLSQRILVRRFPSHALTSGFLRFSVGADSEMRVLNQTIQLWLQKE
jgi:histidinol-phosphate aminotransferase